GFVMGLFLSDSPMHAKAVAEATEHADHTHGGGGPDAALVFPMRNVQALVQPAFDAPGGAVIGQPLGCCEILRTEARHQGDGLGAMVPEVAPEKRDLFDARKIHLLG